ncbi:MAG TPA: tetratricopeptide repeat protein [Anaeromyxobacteraceae bacterium]|jgi:tetratricopeptide (TPR) repeat protein|nr:tetratricopeptide repeat protein [Anaeromyxobacteraceae bacterium]
MSKTEVITRKEMKGPDKFQVAAGEAAGWAKTHEKQIAGGVVAALLVAAVVLGIGQYLRARELKAGALLYRALDAADGEISTVPLPGVQKPLFKSDAERQQAVLSASDDLRRQYPSSDAARTAELLAADAQLRLGKPDQAIGSYQAWLGGAARTDSLRFTALEGLASAHEAKNDLDAAAKDYEQLGREVSFYKDRATLERARVLAKAGKVDEARKALSTFAEDFKDSPLKTEAQERLIRLGGK